MSKTLPLASTGPIPEQNQGPTFDENLIQQTAPEDLSMFYATSEPFLDPKAKIGWLDKMTEIFQKILDSQADPDIKNDLKALLWEMGNLHEDDIESRYRKHQKLAEAYYKNLDEASKQKLHDQLMDELDKTYEASIKNQKTNQKLDELIKEQIRKSEDEHPEHDLFILLYTRVGHRVALTIKRLEDTVSIFEQLLENGSIKPGDRITQNFDRNKYLHQGRYRQDADRANHELIIAAYAAGFEVQIPTLVDFQDPEKGYQNIPLEMLDYEGILLKSIASAKLENPDHGAQDCLISFIRMLHEIQKQEHANEHALKKQAKKLEKILGVSHPSIRAMQHARTQDEILEAAENLRPSLEHKIKKRIQVLDKARQSYHDIPKETTQDPSQLPSPNPTSHTTTPENNANAWIHACDDALTINPVLSVKSEELQSGLRQFGDLKNSAGPDMHPEKRRYPTKPKSRRPPDETEHPREH